jgi:hypothetical protein
MSGEQTVTMSVVVIVAAKTMAIYYEESQQIQIEITFPIS